MSEPMMQEAVGKAIPAGYKQTEVGVIPEDWALLTIDDVASFSGGAQPAKTFFSSKPKDGYIRLIQIRDYKTSEYETYIPEPLGRKLCSEYDIMIGRYGPPIFQILKGICGAYNVALIKAEPKKLIEREYLFYYLKTDKLFSLMDMLSQRSSGQTGVELPALKAYPIPLPPKQEQTAIANVLSDSDALIGALEQLIAKKQAIKSATMQQLLTGRTRLPAFALRPDGTPKGYKPSELGDIPEDWDLKETSSFSAFITKGSTPTTYGFDWEKEGVLFLRSECVSETGLDLSESMYISEKANKALSRSEVKTNDILITITGNVGRVIYLSEHFGKANINQHIARIRVIDITISPKYVYQYMSQIEVRRELNKITTGQAYPQLSLEQVRSIKIALPTIAEQTAIATILSDMDNELQALTQKLEKARALKQGMMQQLLTGKIRLPLAAGA
ncbi:restriction endonuclease subunit S [Aeromonas veronii]|uniref:restriction endonuclease subunit S n=1 Tax=Aeromonas veronii TaxID=654 RepID=UPI00300451DC